MSTQHNCQSINYSNAERLLICAYECDAKKSTNRISAVQQLRIKRMFFVFNQIFPPIRPKHHEQARGERGKGLIDNFEIRYAFTDVCVCEHAIV